MIRASPAGCVLLVLAFAVSTQAFVLSTQPSAFVRKAAVFSRPPPVREQASGFALKVPAGKVQSRTAGSLSCLPSPVSEAEMASGLGTSYPELCVFDLDACLWDQEMFEMQAMPEKKVYGDLNGKGEGVTGVMSGFDKISLHPGSLVALQEYHEGKYPGMKIAAASSADTPTAVKIGRQALKMLEVVPGVTVMDCLIRGHDGQDVNQIGRTPPLSSDKAATHFPRLKEATRISYDKMLFFDDCNWGDHCTNVANRCKEDNGKGVVTYKTPVGLRVQEWQNGMAKYAKERS